MILAPLVVGPQGRAGRALRRAARPGLRAPSHRRRGATRSTSCRKLDRNQKHTIEIVIDRVKIEPPDAAARRPAPAPRRIVRDRAAPRRRPRARGGGSDGGRGAPVLGASSRAPSAATRSPSSSRASSRSTIPMGACPRCDGLGEITFFDPRARGRLPAPVARGRRDPRLGPAQPVLLLDARVPRAALRLRRRGAVRVAARARARGRAERLGRGEDRVPLSRREGAQRREGARLRGHPAEPRAPPPRDRFRGGEGGARQVPQHARLPRVPRHAAAASRRATCASPSRTIHELVGDAAARRRSPSSSTLELPGATQGDRRQDRARDRQPPAVPEQRGPELPEPRRAAPTRSRAARRSASASRPRSAPASPA